MIEAIVTFLGSAMFRGVFEWVMGYFKNKQDIDKEIKLRKLDDELLANQHKRSIEFAETANKHKIEQIELDGKLANERVDISGYYDAAKDVANIKTGIAFVDGWNASIRPAFASIALGLWCLSLWQQEFILTQWDQALVASILGLYCADRTIRHFNAKN